MANGPLLTTGLAGARSSRSRLNFANARSAERNLVAHVLRRMTFGPTAAEVDAAETAGLEATLARLVQPTGTDAGAAATPVPALGPDPILGLGRGATQADRKAAQQTARDQTQRLLGWWLERMVAAEHQFTEKLVFFWHGHWATSVQKVKSGPLMLTQLETLRRYGSGDFAVLTKAMLRDPALVIWLDGQRNTRQAPNENLARELMELFTLGIGAYTEDDIKAGARALTGWTIDRGTGTTVLAPGRHDPTTKTIFGQTGNFDADSYADLLMAQPANAVHLARRFWFRFAAGTAMPTAAEERVSAAYRPGRDITALVRALFTDPEFANTRGSLVKQPIEWTTGALRQLGLRPADLTDERRRQLQGGLDGLGQVPLRPPSVGGWPAGAAWLTTSSLQVRLRLATAFAVAAAPAVLDPLSSGSNQAKADALARLLVVDGWTDRTRAALDQVAGEPRRLLAVGLISPEYTVS
jgi:uncharacterized protein (DUF1800 family)